MFGAAWANNAKNPPNLPELRSCNNRPIKNINNLCVTPSFVQQSTSGLAYSNSNKKCLKGNASLACWDWVMAMLAALKHEDPRYDASHIKVTN